MGLDNPLDSKNISTKDMILNNNSEKKGNEEQIKEKILIEVDLF